MECLVCQKDITCGSREDLNKFVTSHRIPRLALLPEENRLRQPGRLHKASKYAENHHPSHSRGIRNDIGVEVKELAPLPPTTHKAGQRPLPFRLKLFGVSRRCAEISVRAQAWLSLQVDSVLPCGPLALLSIHFLSLCAPGGDPVCGAGLFIRCFVMPMPALQCRCCWWVTCRDGRLPQACEACSAPFPSWELDKTQSPSQIIQRSGSTTSFGADRSSVGPHNSWRWSSPRRTTRLSKLPGRWRNGATTNQPSQPTAAQPVRQQQQQPQQPMQQQPMPAKFPSVGQDKDGVDPVMEPKPLSSEETRQALRAKLHKATAARAELKDYDNPQLVENLDADIQLLRKRIKQTQPISAQLTSVSECIGRRKATISKIELQISDLQNELLACKLATELECQQEILQQEALPASPATPPPQTTTVKDPGQQLEIEKLEIALAWLSSDAPCSRRSTRLSRRQSPPIQVF